MARRWSGLILMLSMAAAVFAADPSLTPETVRTATPSPVATPSNELDQFMDAVLARRKVNWEELDRYLFRERESFEIRGPDGKVVESERGEFDRFVREGELVRSPIRLDGVEVSEIARAQYERRYLREIQEWRKTRTERHERVRREGGVARDNFLDFNFEPGNYYLAGRETFEGRDVLKIEYYPKRMFEAGADDDESDDLRNADFSRSTLVTLLVLPEEHQIVKVTFDNVGLDFLPYRFLVRFGGFQAAMVLDNKLGVWLPREIRATGSATIASGRFQLVYEREFYDYRESDIGVAIEYATPSPAPTPAGAP